MKSSNTNQSNWIFSGIGVVLVALLLIVVNSIVSKSRIKIDTTQHKLHTLTEGTKRILKGLDDQLKKFDSDGERGRITIRLYATLDKEVMPPYFSDYVEKVEALLREFKAQSGERIKLEVIDPQPYSEEEHNAQMNGIQPVPISQDTQVYLGVSISSLKKSVPIPFLNPQNNMLLEYDIARAITEASVTEKPTLGIMSGYQLTGGPGGAQPWYIRTQLARDYNVQDVPLTVDKIDANIDALVIIHPAGIDDSALYAIDQFLLGGGRILALLDAFSLHARQTQGNPQFPGAPAPNAPVSSTLGTLLKPWGIQFDSVNVVADRRYVNRDPRRRNPVFIGIPAKGINSDHPATRQIQYIDLSFSGSFYGDVAEGLTEKVLLSSSDDAGTISPHTLFGDEATARASLNKMETSSKPLRLAISLEGEFKTAFPDGPPKSEPEEGGGDADEEKSGRAAANSLKKSKKPGHVILFADTDFVTDRNAAQVMQIQGGQTIEFPPPNGNIALVGNLVSFLAGNTNLLEVRSRGNISRPFTKYQEMTKESSKEQQLELDELIEKRQTAQRKYNEVREKQARGEQVDAEDIEFLRNYNDDEERETAGRRIVELRRELRKGVDAIEARWKWINIVLIPMLVIIAGVYHLLARRTQNLKEMIDLLFGFKGRVPRRVYWGISIAVGLPLIFLTGFLPLLFPESPILIAIILGLFLIPAIWVSIAVGAKRWHDRNRSALWLLINLVPYVGGLWSFIECGCMRGSEGDNNYGSDPT